jgi:hypothetical protein
MLVNGIGLEFNVVSAELNALEPYDPEWWILGKLWAYRLQTEPFIHIDSDVFLWEALPDTVTSSPVFTQNPEPFIFTDSWLYRPKSFVKQIQENGGWLPPELTWYVNHQGDHALCCGILGGNQVEFINYYAEMALKVVTNLENQVITSQMSEKMRESVLLEQYYLSACIEYHKEAWDSPFLGIDNQCLFDSPEEAFRLAGEVGFTHLIADAKRNKEIAERLEKRVARDYPAQYNKCLKYLEELSGQN